MPQFNPKKGKEKEILQTTVKALEIVDRLRFAQGKRAYKKLLKTTRLLNKYYEFDIDNRKLEDLTIIELFDLVNLVKEDIQNEIQRLEDTNMAEQEQRVQEQTNK